MIVRASTKGQIVIPAEIRRRLNIRPGDCLEVQESDGKLVLRPLGSDPVEAGFGMFAEGPSLTEMLLRERALDKEREERKARRLMK
ncbi:MAG: AbrB/MazE/SpoVT family DNA-binding domain-containing protein [Armatimonadota bacterium]